MLFEVLLKSFTFHDKVLLKGMCLKENEVLLKKICERGNEDHYCHYDNTNLA
jgi:hypothetical protein